jgi:hypothetical protein
LLAILRPSDSPDCSDDLAINVFGGSDELDTHPARTGFTPGKSRYLTKSEDGQRVIGLVHNNVLVALTESDCFSEARVRRPLNALGG